MTMRETIGALSSFQSRLLHAIHGIRDADLRRREGEGRWSIAPVLAHLAGGELVTAARIRAILAEERPALLRYSQDPWVRVHDGESVASLLEQLWFLRRVNLALLQRQPAEAFERTGVHAEYGTLTLRELVERHASHHEQHLAQIVRIKTTLQLEAWPTPFLEGLVSAREGRTRTPAGGITVTELWQDGARHALRVDLEPGAKWPEADHHVPGPEEVYVLSGDFGDGAQRFPAGTFIHHPAGTSHVPQSEGGCSLFVFYPEG
jgi:quercetin dioxygenase-like cupin family protein